MSFPSRLFSVFILAGITALAVPLEVAQAEPGPSYESAVLRITPRSVVSLENGRHLHVVIVVENKSGEDVRVSVGGGQAGTYAFEDAGGKWTMGDPPTGMVSAHDGCSSGTVLHGGEARPVLYRLANSQRSNVPTTVSFGTFLYQCRDGKDVGVPVSIDGIQVHGK